MKGNKKLCYIDFAFLFYDSTADSYESLVIKFLYKVFIKE